MVSTNIDGGLRTVSTINHYVMVNDVNTGILQWLLVVYHGSFRGWILVSTWYTTNIDHGILYYHILSTLLTIIIPWLLV